LVRHMNNAISNTSFKDAKNITIISKNKLPSYALVCTQVGPPYAHKTKGKVVPVLK
jgi:hypothetical protein